MDDRSKQRAETARESDDSAVIDEVMETPPQQGASGGNLQRDVGTQAAEQRVHDPEAHESITKEDHIHHGQEADRYEREDQSDQHDEE